jgi:hypothetical protein
LFEGVFAADKKKRKRKKEKRIKQDNYATLENLKTSNVRESSIDSRFKDFSSGNNSFSGCTI